MLNKYSITARIYPAIICSVPIFVLNYFLLNKYTAGFVASLQGVKWVGGITISIALTFLLAQIGRFIGKELFEKIYFKDELKMPTTNFLLHSDPTYSPDHTNRIHSKILSDFGIRINSPQQEDNNVIAARKIIVESVSMIRGKVGKGRLLLQHNIEYGFIRNLIGGALPALYISMANLYVFGITSPSIVGYYVSIFTTISYLLIVLAGSYLIEKYGVRYAKILIQEYMLPEA
jgi:hypothetical protein